MSLAALLMTAGCLMSTVVRVSIDALPLAPPQAVSQKQSNTLEAE
jgi:hypothetical protein